MGTDDDEDDDVVFFGAHTRFIAISHHTVNVGLDKLQAIRQF